MSHTTDEAPPKRTKVPAITRAPSKLETKDSRTMTKSRDLRKQRRTGKTSMRMAQVSDELPKQTGLALEGTNPYCKLVKIKPLISDVL
jgi:hypothetical protein